MSAAHWPPRALQDFALALPFEHLLRKRAPQEAVARWATEANAYRHAPTKRIGLLLADSDHGSIEQTIASWKLQTWPYLGLVLVGDPDSKRLRTLAAATDLPSLVAAEATPEALAAIGIDWVVPAAAGDLLHPSLAGIVARHAEQGAFVVAWDWLRAQSDGRSIQLLARHRGPWRDCVAELAEDLRSRAFAVDARYWAGHPIADAWRLRLALPAGAAPVHPEPLGIYASTTPGKAPDPMLASNLWGAAFERSAQGMRPAERAEGVSVVILYRDKPELTLKAIESVLAQRFQGRLQLVLVDNQSNGETKARISERLSQLPAGVTSALVSYDEPFNHSRQCMLAANAATEEVLLFLNNDVELLDAEAVDDLSRWAKLPTVATVGVCVVDSSGKAVGGGMRARRLPGAEFNSPVEEAAGPVAGRSRRTVGNTFACAAVSAQAFRALGGLNEIDFPVGYNDVDFCLRAARQGWVHVNLGHLRATHAVGASRARTDEIAQKLALRTVHTWLHAHALVEIDDEAVAAPAITLPELPPSSAEYLEQSP